MDAAPETREPRLIRGIIISRPLQLRGLAWTALERKKRIGWCRERPQAARKIGRASDGGKHFGGRAAEGTMSRNVTRKGGCYEISFLIWHPVARPNPTNPTILRRGVRGLSGPREDCDRIDRQSLVALARGRTCRSDQFNQSRHERQTVRMIGWAGRLRRLPQLSHEADKLDRPAAIVKPFQPPRSAGGVVESGIHGEVDFYVPFQIID